MAERRSHAIRMEIVREAREIASRRGMVFLFSPSLVALFMEAFSHVVADELRQGGTVRIPNVGILYMRDCAARTGFNPHVGQSVGIPAKRCVRFRKSRILARQVEKVLSNG